MAHARSKLDSDTAARSYDLYDTLSHLLRRSHFHAETLFSKQLGSYGITSRQLALLVAVSQKPDMTQRQIGEIIALDMNTVSDLLRRMQKNGLVERRASETDARSMLICLTENGTSMLERIHEDNRAYQDNLASRLSDAEAKTLKSLLLKLLDLEK